MLRIDVDAEDLAHTRFACSALHETMASLRVLADPGAHAMQLPWLRDALPRLHGLELALLRSLVPSRGYVPDFVTPPPDSPIPEFDAELQRVMAVGPQQVQAEISIAFAGRPPAVVREAFSDPAAGLRRLATELRAYYGAVIRDWWPAIHAVLEADIVHRARLLADRGARALFAQLHPAVKWHPGGRLTVEIVYDARVSLDGRGLVLMPSVFTWPSLGATTDPPWQPTLVYPARGIATVWELSTPRTPEALGRVLGRTRARLLATLETPHTGTAIAQALDITAGAVSQHITAMRAAGLVATHRDGRHVICRRTALGEQLLEGAGRDRSARG
jgi:DNA-binding transcriptional ArsR family regulator